VEDGAANLGRGNADELALLLLPKRSPDRFEQRRCPLAAQTLLSSGLELLLRDADRFTRVSDQVGERPPCGKFGESW